MQLKDQRIVITGGTGGIGRVLTEELAARGARLCHLARNHDHAESPKDIRVKRTENSLVLYCDIGRAEQREEALNAVERAWGGVDILINLAGVLDFRPFQDEDPVMLQRILQINVEAPMQLARAVLPGMLERGRGRIVNVGSMFGSIGFPYFAAYSASKFALRGYSQALRRELAGTGVGVSYVSPRAVNTPLNPPVVHEMAARGMMRMDQPGPVAQGIVRAIEKDLGELYLGFPESLFARINGIFPGLVDRALIKQLPALMHYALGQKGA
ncbi:MAG: SDR family oxidoreductase [Gallionellaceae bacterium]|nr:SDR family oxidoreductase [Gallionellaceae bacterium]MDD5364986.1 SDR family oxidoreductase [Gallionellaceae bacterium]